jgi:hypothetical protein
MCVSREILTDYFDYVSGEVLFYRNARGEALRRPADEYRVNPKDN